MGEIQKNWILFSENNYLSEKINKKTSSADVWEDICL
jgi:hypothetical protein